MFPTPPTNENQHTLSPGNGPDCYLDDSYSCGSHTLLAEPTLSISVSSKLPLQ